VPKKATKPDKRKVRHKSKYRTEVLAQKILDPDATVREIAARVGCGSSTAAELLRDLKNMPEYRQALVDCFGLIPLAVQVYRDLLLKGDRSVAHDIIFGLGLLSNKSEIEFPGGVSINGIDDIRAALDRLTTAELRRAIQPDGSGGARETPVSGLVDSDQSSPDAQG
jgi:hypothetical protein